MDWLSGNSMLFEDVLHSLLLWLLVIGCPSRSWSTFIWLFGVVSLANGSMAFASFGSISGNWTMLTIVSLHIAILWLSVIS